MSGSPLVDSDWFVSESVTMCVRTGQLVGGRHKMVVRLLDICTAVGCRPATVWGVLQRLCFGEHRPLALELSDRLS